MPWGWECKAKFVKQNPAKPTQRRGKAANIQTPPPNSYEPPKIFCADGFGKIKRAPAYTFGNLTKLSLAKPAAAPNALTYNVRGQLPKGGPTRITHSVISPQIEPIGDRTKTPGPATYCPTAAQRYKRPPAYSMRPPARPPYQAWDQWTPPPNMYWPKILAKKPPAYTLGNTAKDMKSADGPGPGEHEPNYNYVRKKIPAFSFAGPFKPIKPPKTPPPNIYCEKKFNVTKRSIPAPSFGIRHSPYMGQQEVYLKPSDLDLTLKSG